MLTTRLAPSPTGNLHLGNALSFLLSWLHARKNRGRILLRIDDIDPQRSKREFTQAAMDDMQWLGLDWDDVIYQSDRLGEYKKSLQNLERKNLVYPCFCTRKDLRSLASAPQIGDMGAPYPGFCRNLTCAQIEEKRSKGNPSCMRLRCPDGEIVFSDLIAGPQRFSPGDFGGDFALVRSDGVFAYQLATVVDDAAFEVNFVLRGRDLLCSTPRQILLFKLLGLKIPAFAHTPLVLDHNGDRLAKRHKSLSIKEIRKTGISPQKAVGFLAHAARLLPSNTPCAPGDLLQNFNMGALPPQDIILPANIIDAIECQTKFF